jgi:hypothetical protein
VVNNDMGVSTHPTAMKSGLNESPLPEPKVSFADDQPVAGELLQHPRVFFQLAKALSLGNQDLPNQVGVIHQIETERRQRQAERSDVPIRPPQIDDELKRVFTDAIHVAESE